MVANNGVDAGMLFGHTSGNCRMDSFEGVAESMPRRPRAPPAKSNAKQKQQQQQQKEKKRTRAQKKGGEKTRRGKLQNSGRLCFVEKMRQRELGNVAMQYVERRNELCLRPWGKSSFVSTDVGRGGHRHKNRV